MTHIIQVLFVSPIYLRIICTLTMMCFIFAHIKLDIRPNFFKLRYSNDRHVQIYYITTNRTFIGTEFVNLALILWNFVYRTWSRKIWTLGAEISLLLVIYIYTFWFLVIYNQNGKVNIFDTRGLPLCYWLVILSISYIILCVILKHKFC